MNNSFEYITSLQYCLKAARKQIADFKSGEKYIQMETMFRKAERAYEATIKALKLELSQAHSETVTVRNIWFDEFERLQQEFEKEIEKLLQELKKMEQRALKAESQRDTALDKVTEQRRRIYQLETELEAEKGKNIKLTAQLNHDYENSSIPSSMSVKKKKISNSREKTGRKPGGQPGHKGHCRKKQDPTQAPVLLPPPQEIQEDPDFKKTKKTIIKQLVGIRVCLTVKEYHADVYRNSKTGERVHAAFPAGVVDDVNYDGSIKAFLFLLNNDCCVSIDKSRKFLSDLTDGKLNISKGMINKLGREFAQKTENEQRELFYRLLSAPVMHTDWTNARESGKNTYVFVCTTPNGETMYFSRAKKGHEGIKGTPVEDYQGILVHDHESTFYRYGSNHQECLAHVLRYLKDSMENEKDRTWNKEMHTLLQEMIHYINSVDGTEERDEKQISRFEEKYRRIMQKAGEEYEYIPPSDYYRDGYNLYRRMEKLMDNHLLFLHDPKVPFCNNAAERRLRNYKRKQRQAVSFRSVDSIDYLCQGMSMLIMMRENNINVFDRVAQIFG